MGLIKCFDIHWWNCVMLRISEVYINEILVGDTFNICKLCCWFDFVASFFYF